MNFKQIDAAVAGYKDSLDTIEMDRLSLFRKIWEEQALLAHEYASVVGFELPSNETLIELHQAQTPVFAQSGVSISAEALTSAQVRLAAVLISDGGYSKEVVEGLASFPWNQVNSAAQISLTGTNPGAFLDKFYLEAQKIEVSDCNSELDCKTCSETDEEESAFQVVTNLATLISSLALRAFLQAPAKQVIAAFRKAGEINPRPTACPVCGSEASVARIGDTDTAKGSGRELWCSQCGSAWVFERIRCARCGTHNQAHLHYFNIEGDDAHRIATCDECGDYIRTIYQEDACAPFSYDVEDVVMARLDFIALNQMEVQMDSVSDSDEN